MFTGNYRDVTRKCLDLEWITENNHVDLKLPRGLDYNNTEDDHEEVRTESYNEIASPQMKMKLRN